MSARKQQYETVSLLDLERPEQRAERKRIRRRGTSITLWRSRKGVMVPGLECLPPVERVSPTQFERWLTYVLTLGDEEERV